jgi:hypothetical protein
LKLVRLVAAIAILIAAYLLWGYWTADEPREAAMGSAPGASTKAPATPARPSSGSGIVAGPDRGAQMPQRPSAGPAAASPAGASLREQVRATSDLRALYEQLKNGSDPRGEGSFHLGDAIGDCAQLVDKPFDEVMTQPGVPRAAAYTSRREEVMRWSIGRCKGFERLGATAMARMQAELYSRAEAAGYPAAVARSLYADASRRTPEQADTVAVTLLLQGADGATVNEIGRYLDARNAGGQWPPGGDAQDWRTAWMLLPCSYGADCGPTSRAAVGACILTAACSSSSMAEVVLAMGTSPDTLRRATALRDDLVARMAAGDWTNMGFTRK